MKDSKDQKIFRNRDGLVDSILSDEEGFSFTERPFDFFIRLARYKFAARLLKKSDDVLDAGCGPGVGTVFLSKFAKRVTGGDYDLNVNAVNVKRYGHIPNIDFMHLDLLNIGSHKRVYDAVVSMDVIEHFYKEQTDTVAKHYAELVKPGGFAVIGTPNIASKSYASVNRRRIHFHEFEPAELEALLEKYFHRVFLFSMTDEVVSLTFSKMAWYLMALCIK